MRPGIPLPFLIRHVTEDRANAICAFQSTFPSEFLWPRDLLMLRTLVQNESLYEALELSSQGEVTVGMCYVTDGEWPDGRPRFEFGGINVADACRGLGIATALGMIAIGSHFAWDPLKNDMDLIAHVHQDNQAPRKLLRALGFAETGEVEIPPQHLAPSSMKRNEKGEVVGDLFKFRRAHLAKVADWISSVDCAREVLSRKCEIQLTQRFNERRQSMVEALRDLSSD